MNEEEEKKLLSLMENCEVDYYDINEHGTSEEEELKEDEEVIIHYVNWLIGKYREELRKE